MNPLKPKVIQRNKLLTRFNISLHNRTHTEQMVRLNTSKEKDENMNRYRNHINYLEDRIEEQDNLIEKLYLDLEMNGCMQEKLNAMIDKLKCENKSILKNLSEAESKISHLEFKTNHQMLCRSIEKIDKEMTMSRSKKKYGLVEFAENPQKSLFKTPRTAKTHHRMFSESVQSSVRQMSMFQSLKLSSQLYQISIKPKNPSIEVFNENLAEQMKKKQSQLALQNVRVTKLQQAIYYLKKQLKQKVEIYQKQIYQLSVTNQKQKQKYGKQNEQLIKFTKKEKELIQRISQLEKQISFKDEQIVLFEEKVTQTLKQVETKSIKQHQQMKLVINCKTKEIDILNRQLKNSKEIIKGLQIKNDEVKSNMREMEKKLQEKMQEFSKNEKQLSNMLFMISQLKNEHKDVLTAKQKQIKELQDKLMLAERQLKHIYLRISEHEEKQESQSSNTKTIQEEYGAKIQTIKSELRTKEEKLEQEEKKHLILSKRVTQLEQALEKIKKNQSNLNNNLLIITRQVQELQQMKENHLDEIQNLHKNIRHFEGQIAQKQYLLNSMIEQMLMIKDKFLAEKIDSSSQYDISQQCQSEHPEQQQEEKQQKINVQQLHHHFSLILKQKQQQYNQLLSELEKQRSKCQQLQKEMDKSTELSQRYETQLQEAHHKIQQLQQHIYNYENLLEENKNQIDMLKRNINELQEKQAFFQEYITQIKANSS